MTKKGENIYKRKDGRWEGRYIKERSADHKIKYGYIYGKKYGEVKNKLTVLKAKYLNQNKPVKLYQGFYEDWATYWLNYRIKPYIKDTTYYSYTRLLQGHLLPALGKKRLHTLSVEVIQTFINELVQKNLSSGTIRNIFALVNKSLKEAVKNHYLEKNPCEEVELPKFRRTKIHALSITEQKKLELYAFQEKECSPIILALYTGMRIGEISALRWEDIDFEKNEIHVHQTVYRILDEESLSSKTKITAGSVKSTDSDRIIPVAENFRNYLLEKKKNHLSDYLITCKGGIAEPRVINYRFQKTLKELQLPSIHFHALRHSFATRCLEQGVDIASLSKLLGHHSIKMTLDTYTDSMMEKRQEAVSRLDAMMVNF